MRRFKVGDRVLCIDAIHTLFPGEGEVDFIPTLFLKKDEVYIVEKIDLSGWIYINSLRRWYHESRFELTNQYPTLRGDYEAIQRG